VQMRHDQKDPMKAYWSTVEQFSVCPFTERWNETDSFTYWDFCTSLTTKQRSNKQMTDYGQ
jgi:hypothetical protein